MSIANERLAELIAHHESMSTPGRHAPLTSVSDRETLALYLELQEWRSHMPDCPTCGRVRPASMYLCQCEVKS